MNECSIRLTSTVTSAKRAPSHDFFPKAFFAFLSSDCKNLEDFGQNGACVYCNTCECTMQNWQDGDMEFGDCERQWEGTRDPNTKPKKPQKNPTGWEFLA